MKRKMTQVYSPVKEAIQYVQKQTGLKNESETIGYLFALYEARYDKISLKEHQDAIEKTHQLHNQQTI